jgi:hypothetical protein
MKEGGPPPAEASAAGLELAVSSQLSALSSQLSALSSQLSALSFQRFSCGGQSVISVR